MSVVELCHHGMIKSFCSTCRDEELTMLRYELSQARAQLEEMKARFTAPIVCICGSTRFKQTWIAENARLTSEGYIVLAVGLWGHHERVFPSPEQKAKLDGLHKRKIDLCDWVWVLDVGGYIGDSTRSEIEYAERLGKPVRYLSQEFPGYVEPKDPLLTQLEEAQEERRAMKGAWLQARQAQMATDLRAAKVREENERLKAAAKALLEESTYWTKQRCAEVGEEYGQGTDAERAMRELLAYRAESCPAAEEVEGR